MSGAGVGVSNGRRPLVLINDDPVLDDVLRLAAAAGCDVERVPDVAAVRRNWSGAPLVLLDARAAAECAQAGLPRHPLVVLVCAADPEPGVWRQAVAVGADRVLELPGGEAWLVSVLADLVEGPSGRTGRALAVLGGRGGAGASVFAVAVAKAALRAGHSALLVDCDPLGGGLDLALGAETSAGPRWPELRLTGGRIAASALRSALPGAGRGDAALTVLSCDRTGAGPGPDAVAAVLDAGRRAGDLVVCDLPRQPGEVVNAVLDRADLAVLVVPAEVRACLAARQVAGFVLARGTPLRLLVRGPAPGGLDVRTIGAALDVPLLHGMRPEPGLAEALERGRFPTRARGPLASAADAALAALGYHPAPGTPGRRPAGAAADVVTGAGAAPGDGQVPA
ncbi:septum site-determining protein Ssd [Goodfellowiella coeruleoviolacea]|uniref:Helicase/secretion neighborhood CpaE-like protein n=1 Tax=Goodfellowiella coeruleoviolacea TaxID=334858 RepID=A0AAE3GB87_9PSEU|nr:septum site-determining protein Ssd [Goodfellowiella coeruleoviolacea]MCP2164628.1 helicase/secretion neighborhood CpaE-like protein [Goodfellowiella coeruleoviolacea]